MTQTTLIECDRCGRDLTTTGNSIAYRLALIAESIPPKGACVTDMMVYPPLKQTGHFCDLACLAEWMKPKAPLREETT